MTKSTLLQFYSIVKIVKAKDLPQLSKTYKDSQERLLVMFKKKPENPNQPPKWFTNYMDGFEKKIDQKIYDAINNPSEIPAWFKKWNQEVFVPVINNIMKEIKSIKADITKINIRLNKIEGRLDKHEQLFRSHGWIK